MSVTGDFPAAIRPWLDIAISLAEAAGTGAAQAWRDVRPARRKSFRTRRPGAETPLWNACATLLKEELKTHGAKARLARYLGVPKQRLSDFLAGNRRLPDAELALQMLHWLAERRAGRDPSL